MAQVQLEFSEDTINYLTKEGFNFVQWSPVLNHIKCKIDDLEEKGEKLFYFIEKRKITSEIDN